MSDLVGTPNCWFSYAAAQLKTVSLYREIYLDFFGELSSELGNIFGGPISGPLVSLSPPSAPTMQIKDLSLVVISW